MAPKEHLKLLSLLTESSAGDEQLEKQAAAKPVKAAKTRVAAAR